jgi:hypothetical protein
VTRHNDGMNRLIRSAGGRSNVLTLIEPSRATDVEPVGRTSVGYGAVTGLPPRRDDRDEVNAAIRESAQIARQFVVPHGVDLFND